MPTYRPKSLTINIVNRIVFLWRSVVVKNILLFMVALIAVALILTMVWPLSFLDVIADGKELHIISWQPAITTKSEEYDVKPNTEKFKQIRQVLGLYSYHRTWRTFFFWDTSLNNDALGTGYTFSLYALGDGGNYISSVGTDEILVNGRIYRIGYWGNRKALEMMDEIRSVLAVQ